MRKVIHQIYWDFYSTGKKAEDIEHYRIPMEKTKKYCKDNNILYNLWNYRLLEQLVVEHFHEYLDLWKYFWFPIQKADFIRYLILYKYGGIYIDCDVHPLNNINDLFERDYFFIKRKNGVHPYNAIMGSKPHQIVFFNIIEHCQESTFKKQEMTIYRQWLGRLVFQTTGERMLDRVLKNNKNILNILCTDLEQLESTDKFFDFNKGEITTSLWYDDLMKYKFV
tara:strand:+ start:708 stop:1376 length:669 start_codon:yes stop_codon:yes gene_type:complete